MSKRTSNTVVALISTLVASLVIAGGAVADRGRHGDHGTRVKVTPKNMKGWAFANEGPIGSGMLVRGPGRPLGKGSAELRVNDTGREILYKSAYQGTYLRDVRPLAYLTFRQQGSSAVAISLQFNIDYDLTDAVELYQGRLVYEPYFTHTVQTGAWQGWNTQDNAAAGNWWSTRPPGSLPGNCPQSDPCTWSEMLTKFPNVGIHRIYGLVLLRAGGPWLGGFLGNTDALVVGVRGHTTVYDFEPNHGDEH